MTGISRRRRKNAQRKVASEGMPPKVQGGFAALRKEFERRKAFQTELEREGETEERVRIPRPNQVIGILEQRVGGSRMRVRCMDGKARICRVPGRLKRKLWVREGDFVLVEPWEYAKEGKGDIIFKYKQSHIEWLRAKGFLKEIEEKEF